MKFRDGPPADPGYADSRIFAITTILRSACAGQPNTPVQERRATHWTVAVAHCGPSTSRAGRRFRGAAIPTVAREWLLSPPISLYMGCGRCIRCGCRCAETSRSPRGVASPRLGTTAQGTGSTPCATSGALEQAAAYRCGLWTTGITFPGSCGRCGML